MRVDPGARSDNLRRAAGMIGAAAAGGADVVLLPEAMDLGWTYLHARREAEPIAAGEAFRVLRDAATRHALHVCAGLTERSLNRVYNAAVLMAPDGALLLTHRKINELAFARSSYDTGTQLAVVDTRLGRLGIMICADALAQSGALVASLGMMGAQALLSPCAWAGRPCIGNSIVYDRSGREVVTGPYGENAEALLFADITLRQEWHPP